MKIRYMEITIVKCDKAIDDGFVKGSRVDEHTVRAACADAIARAKVQGISCLELPAFGTAAGFPVTGCAKIMAQEVLRCARESEENASLKQIVLCLSTDEVFRLFEKQVYGYLHHVIDDLGWGPYVTTDIIIEVAGGIILIERTNPPFGWALPGGFVDRGESLETAARREAKEETAMDLEELEQLHTYSDPSRDARFHTVTTVFTAKGKGIPLAGDDAKGLKVVPFAELRKLSYAFDHNKVIEDYLRKRFP
jgi:ADP-ribose pyrophosphatase YjhB (NUDIX family)